MNAQPITIEIDGGQKVSGLVQQPKMPRACYVLAHGAGAGMAHPFMQAVASGLADRQIATLRYQFLYMEQRGKRPDPPKVAHAIVRAAVAKAAELFPKVPLLAGGKSFGGRMTSQAQAVEAMDHVAGLVFLGFPLHPAGKPSTERATHLSEVRIPMLFLQGTRDELATLSLIEQVCNGLGKRATLELFQDADHSFHVRARSGRKDPEVLAEALDTIATWSSQLTTF
jgi:uncharacterized protein